MRNSFIPYLCLFVSILSPLCGITQNYDKSFDDILRKQLSIESPGGTALVAKDGKVLYRKSFGMANLELDVPMKPDQVFRIGSITKQFTASAIMKLIEEGKLSLSDTITKFIKDYPTHGYTITIEHLLTHTSGIKDYTGLGKFNGEVRKKDFTPKELVDFFKDEPMDFPPGSNYRYSNSGYILLGYIIELVSKKPYPEYISENFLLPLGMESTRFDNGSDIVPGRVSGYQKRNGHFENADYLSMTLAYSAGSLLSNVDDLLIWHESIMDDRLLGMKMREKAHTSHTLSNGNPTGYGYGWEIGNIQGSPSIKHVGRINGFVTYSVYLPLERIFVAIFTNCDCTDNLDNPASRMAAIVMDRPYQWTTIKLTDKEYASYQAVYESSEEGQNIIRFENGRLLYFRKGGSKTPLIPVGKDSFLIENSLATLKFDRDQKGNIDSFYSKGTGLPITWIRKQGAVRTLKAVQLSPQRLEKYVGDYQFGNGLVFTILREGKRMYGQVGRDRKEILPYAVDKFFAKDIDAKIIFNLDKNGKVIGLTKIQSDEMIADKLY